MSAARNKKAETGGAKAPSWPSKKLAGVLNKNVFWKKALEGIHDLECDKVVAAFDAAEKLAAVVIFKLMTDDDKDIELFHDDVRAAVWYIWDKSTATNGHPTAEQVEEVFTWAQENYNNGVTISLCDIIDSAKASTLFRSTKDGLFFLCQDKSGNPVKIQVTKTPIEVLAVTTNDEETKWGRLIEVTNLNNRKKQWAIPMSMLLGNADDARRTLADLGLVPGNSKMAAQLLVQYLNEPVSDCATCVTQPGWNPRGHVYVAPTGDSYNWADPETTDKNILARYVLQSEQPMTGDFASKGTLAGWQEHVGRYCVGNPRLALAVSAALAAPLLTPLGLEGGGIHIHGRSSRGKTTCMSVAGSVCGGPGFVRSWRSTANGLEAIAIEHNDHLLCLDEFHHIEARDAAESPYMLGNGVGKARASRDGTLGKPPARWRLLYLSSGELTLAEKLAQDTRTAGHAKAGQAVRFVEIPLNKDGSVFDEIHGHADGAAFAATLKAAVLKHHGTAFPAFMAAVAKDFSACKKRVRTKIKQFQELYTPAGADGQVQRVADRFGLLAAAGELGTDLGVLPWPAGEATRAARACFTAWLEERGGTGGHEIIHGIEQVRAFLLTHGNSRFESQDSLETMIPLKDRCGYRKLMTDGSQRFWVFPKAFREELCAGFDAKVIGIELVRRGMIQPDSTSGHYTRPELLPAPFDKKTRVVVILPKILEDQADAEDDEE